MSRGDVMIVFNKLWLTMEAKGFSTYRLREKCGIDSKTIRSFGQFQRSLRIIGTPKPQNISWNGNPFAWNNVSLFKSWEDCALNEEDKDRLCKAALGLTMQEAENAFALAMVNNGKLDKDDLDWISNIKTQTDRMNVLVGDMLTLAKMDEKKFVIRGITYFCMSGLC